MNKTNCEKSLRLWAQKLRPLQGLRLYKFNRLSFQVKGVLWHYFPALYFYPAEAAFHDSKSKTTRDRSLTCTWSLLRRCQTRLWDEEWSFLREFPAWRRALHRSPAGRKKELWISLFWLSGLLHFYLTAHFSLFLNKKVENTWEPHNVKVCLGTSPLTQWQQEMG